MTPVPERLLRLSIAHYKKPNVSDEAFHRWATEEHCVRAASIHARHGVQAFNMVSAYPGTLLAPGKPWIHKDTPNVSPLACRQTKFSLRATQYAGKNNGVADIRPGGFPFDRKSGHTLGPCPLQYESAGETSRIIVDTAG